MGLFTQDYVLETSLWLPMERSKVFNCFADAFQLEEMTPPWLNFRVQTPAPIEMHEGQLIDYRLRLHGIPVRWRTEITRWNPPESFEDSQLRGPYQKWHHLHTFEEVDGGTLVKDHVEYRSLGGPLIHYIFVKRDLHRIFEFRQRQLPRLLDVDESRCKVHEVVIRIDY